MSFFTVGFLLSNIQLNLGWEAGYALKLVGALFILGGIAELGYFAPAVKRERGLSLLLLGACIAATAGAFLVKGKSSMLVNTDSIVNGAATTALAALFFMRLIAVFKDTPELFENPPVVKSLEKHYTRFLMITGAALAADILNRVTGGTVIADAAGLIAFFAKLIGYAFLLMSMLDFNKLRAQFYKLHP
ncbi:MAG: hypothetical protein IJ561_01780 [Ruminococcus sp.]|nr:hypothetical protein [Ruminococcus sp.]